MGARQEQRSHSNESLLGAAPYGKGSSLAAAAPARLACAGWQGACWGGGEEGRASEDGPLGILLVGLANLVLGALYHAPLCLLV